MAWTPPSRQATGHDSTVVRCKSIGIASATLSLTGYAGEKKTGAYCLSHENSRIWPPAWRLLVAPGIVHGFSKDQYASADKIIKTQFFPLGGPQYRLRWRIRLYGIYMITRKSGLASSCLQLA